MGLLNKFKRRKNRKTNQNTDQEFEEMFDHELDEFAKEQFDINLNLNSYISDDALAEFLNNRSLPECSDHAYNKYQYAEKLYKQGKLDASIKVLNDAIKLGNVTPVVYKRLAIIYRKKKDYKSELAVINEALRLYEGKIDVKTSFKDFSIRKKRVLELIEKARK